MKGATVPEGERISEGAEDTEGVRPKKRVRACVEQLSAIPTHPPYYEKCWAKGLRRCQWGEVVVEEWGGVVVGRG